MNIYFAGSYQQLLKLNVLQFLVKHQIRAQLRDIKLQILLREDCRFALIGYYCHEFRIYLALLSQQQGY